MKTIKMSGHLWYSCHLCSQKVQQLTHQS